MLNLHPDHIKKLQDSGLADEFIHQLVEAGLVRSLTPREIGKLAPGGFPGVESILELKYPNLDFARYRCFPPMHRNNGKEQRYWQPSGTGVHLYVPDRVRPFLMHLGAPLEFTEGEIKALSGANHNMNCLGVGGVWAWLEDGNLLSEIEGIPLVDRFADLVFDSDIWHRPDLLFAVYCLGRELAERGAKVKAVVIPPENGSKVGLDDFLVKHGSAPYPSLKRIGLTDPPFKRLARQYHSWKLKRQKAQVERLLNPPQNRNTGNDAQMTAEEQREAMALLQRKDLLLQYFHDIEKLGCTGEESNKTVLYLAYTSRLLRRPISINVKGESSGGKNFLVQSVGRFLPPESVQFISNATPKALYYLPEDLTHKVVVIAETVGGQDADYSIRTFQSEGEIVILVPEKDKGSGRIETKERRVKGPAAFIQTTTRAHLHQENETRSFDLFIDESEQQTEGIFKAQNAEYRGDASTLNVDGLLEVWRNAQRLLKPLPVVIPYVDAVEFPTKPLRVRRDRPRFLALIESSALLHQHQREKRDINGQKHIVASLDDYKIARELGVMVLGPVLKGATPRCEVLVEAASGFESDFTRTQIAAKLGWERKTVIKYLNEAVDLGCLDETPQGSGKSITYEFVKKIEEVGSLLPEVQELEERLTNLPKVGETAFGQVNRSEIKENGGGIQGVQEENSGDGIEQGTR